MSDAFQKGKAEQEFPVSKEKSTAACKTKPPESPAAQASPAPSRGARPPGRVLKRGRHGPPQPPASAMPPIDRLRAALELTADVPAGEVIREAAERLVQQPELIRAEAQRLVTQR